MSSCEQSLVLQATKATTKPHGEKPEAKRRAYRVRIEEVAGLVDGSTKRLLATNNQKTKPRKKYTYFFSWF